MDATSVTLDEVIAAARVRAASLVPETSGYLALAIADASARLPFRLEDRMVSLSTEGSVVVKRGSEVVEPEESAVVLRDTLGRLLALSIGSAPSLASAARTRARGDQVEAFIHELETALVPVNRAAARRALARLARETVRAREAGKLKRRRASERPVPVPSRLAPTAPAADGSPNTRREGLQRRTAPVPAPVAPVVERVEAAQSHALPTPVDVDIPVDVDLVGMARLDVAGLDVDSGDATPLELEPPVVLAGEAATSLDTELAERILRLEPMQHTELGAASRSDVDELLARFRLSEGPSEPWPAAQEQASAKVTIATPRAIAKLAGIDLSAVPPPVLDPVARPAARQPPPGRTIASDEMVLVVRRRPARPSELGSAPVASLEGPEELEALQDLENAESEVARHAGRSRWPLAVVAALGLAAVAGVGHFTNVLW
jgi:hypothetical protein